MTYLLDVNVLIALLDPDHVHHERAHRWFAQVGHLAWATCPLTQMAVPRILGNPRYPNSRGTPAAIMPYVRALCAHPRHQFWYDDISILDSKLVDGSRVLDCGQITDTYLLALAAFHQGRLATFDRRLVADAVHGGRVHIELIG